MRIRLPKPPPEGAGNQLPSQPVGTNGSIVIGVDPSSRKVAAVAIDSNGGALTFTHEVDKDSATRDRAGAVYELGREFHQWLWELSASRFHLFVEQPLFGRNVNTMRVISQVEGVVLDRAVLLGAAGVYEVNVQVWKKDVVGKGNAGKPEVKLFLEEHHHDLALLADGDQDLIDAACIALYGDAIIARGRSLAS